MIMITILNDRKVKLKSIDFIYLCILSVHAIIKGDRTDDILVKFLIY